MKNFTLKKYIYIQKDIKEQVTFTNSSLLIHRVFHTLKYQRSTFDSVP